MLPLILAILSSALVSIMMRLGESAPGSRMGLLAANYTVCSLIGAFFTVQSGIPGSGLSFSILLGIFSGFLFLYSLVVFQKSIGKNGIVLSSTFMKLGVLVPTIMAILVFQEAPGVAQIGGLVLAVAAILVLNFQPGQTASGKWLLILLLLVCGGTDAVTNVYDKLGNPAGKDFFLLVIFGTALVCSLFLMVKEGQRPSRWNLLCGIGVGIPNYFSSRFLLGALKTVPAVVVFPVYSTATILLITTAGILFFHERLDWKKGTALLLILAALVLLNL